MTRRNATCAIVGAGDFIGSAICERFAAEGYTVFAGRRTAEKLAPLKARIEAAGGAAQAIAGAQKPQRSVNYARVLSTGDARDGQRR